MSGVEVRPVGNARERRLFLTFPWRVYRGDPLWVPPLLPERRTALDPRRGPWFRHGTLACFIAWCGRRPVGTILVAEDRTMNEARHLREAIFGFFECLDDEEAARALFDAARGWARARRLDSLHGPFNLDYEDGYGVLVEGRDRPPVLLCGHSPPYYQRLVEGYGFTPARADNIAYLVSLSADFPEWHRVQRLADRIRRRGWITIRVPSPSRWRDEIDVIRELLNRGLAHLEDFLPWSRAMVEEMLAQFVRVVDPELVLFAEVEGRTVGWFPGIKNLNEALIHANGLRCPWDWVRLALAMRRRPACLAVKSILILPEYWRSGVAILLFDEMRRRAQARGYRWVDLSLTSLDNPYTPDLATRMGGTIYKRYRVYRIEA